MEIQEIGDVFLVTEYRTPDDVANGMGMEVEEFIIWVDS